MKLHFGLIAIVIFFFSISLLGNIPSGPEADGNDKAASSGNDNSDGTGATPPEKCSLCGRVITPGSHSDTPPSGGGEPGCISMEFSFGRLVHSDIIPHGKIKLLSDAPSPKLFTPQGLSFDYNLESYATDTDGQTTVIRPNGYQVTYSNGAPTKRQSSFRSNLVVVESGSTSSRQVNALSNGDSLTEEVIPDNPGSGSSQLTSHPSSFYRNFGNGSKGFYQLYAGQKTQTGYYRLMKLITRDGMELTSDHRDIGIEVIRDNEQSLRQIRSQADGLADIVITNEYSYEIRMYAPGDVLSKNSSNGLLLYTVRENAEPYLVWRIENPEQDLSKIDKVKVTRFCGSQTYIYNWSYNSSNDCWSLTEGCESELKVNSKQKTKTPNAQNYERSMVVTKDIKNSQNEVISRTVEEYTKYDFGEMLTKIIFDPNGTNQQTSKEYYLTGDNVSAVKNTKYATGNWEYFAYDTSKRQTRRISAFKNLPYGETENYAVTEENEYVADYTDDRPRMKIRKINGVVVQKEFHSYNTASFRRTETSEVAVAPDTQAGSSTNLKTIKVFDTQTERLISVTHPNGCFESYTYEYGTYTPENNTPGTFTVSTSGNALRETIIYGTLEHPEGIPGKTTKKVSVSNEYGDKVLEATYACLSSGYELAAFNIYSYDAMHKLLRSYSSNSLEKLQSWQGDQLVSSTADTGVEMVYAYDSADRLKSITKKGMGDKPDLITTYTYDAADRKLSETVSAGSESLTKSWTYDTQGNILSETDTNGLTTSYQYTFPNSSRGRIIKKIHPGGFTTITELYFDGQVKSITGTAQAAVYYDYGADSASNCSWVKESYGAENSSRWKKTYTNMFGQISKVEESGYNGAVVVTQYFYNTKGQLARTSKTGMADTLYVYDELGTLIRSGLDVNGNGTLDLASSDRIQERNYGYIKENTSLFFVNESKVYGVKDSDAVTTLNTEKIQLTNLPGGVTALKYQIDRYGNITEFRTTINRSGKTVTTTVTYPDSVIPSERILENALLVSEKSKSGLLYSYSYDGLERKVSSTDPRTGTSTYSYYSSGTGKTGQLQSMTDPAGHVTTYDYEETTGRLKSVKNALNQYTYYSYNSYGQQIYQWGDSVYPVALEYDSLGQKIQQKTYRSGSSWSSPNWPSSENADVTTWSYDASSGLVTSKTDAQNHSVSYTYTSDGKLQTRTWARQAAGQALVTTYTYDNATGELLKADYSDGTPDIVRTYDRLGNLSSVSDAAGTRNFTYNSYFDLTGETLGNRTLSYTYATTGVKGRYTGLTGNHSYGYDAYGRLNQINNISYSYTANSDLLGSVTRPNEVNSAWTYESHRDLVSSLENQHQTELRSRYAYVNDALGRRTSMSRSGSVFSRPETLNYSYNDRSEVTGATSDVNSAYSYAYSFDPIGNRLSASLAGTVYAYTTNSLNQYTAVNAVVPTYDADGNMLTNGVWSYTWNGENRLIKAENAASGMKLEFDYDYMGRRIYKKVYENNTLVKHLNFVYDGYKLIEEFDGLNGDALVRRYVWQSEDFGLDVPVSVYDAAVNKTYFYHTDANKNITELSDENGGIVAHYEYSPFGSLTASSGEYAEENPFRFSSEYSDMETGLVYYNYRYYSPELGRWLSRDPIEEQGGWNLYNFIFNNPFSQFDALGAHGVVLFAKPVVPRVNPSTLPKPKPPTGVLPKPNLPRGNGIPLPKDGFKPPKNWNGQKVRCPNGKGSGYPDKKGNVWEPTDHKGTHRPHWDIQHPDGTHTPKYPTF